MKQVTLKDGTIWPDPTSYQDAAWRMIHAPESVTKEDLMGAVSVMDAYSALILHPAFTLKHVQDIVSGIRKEIV
jgi:hypothetical protein